MTAAAVAAAVSATVIESSRSVPFPALLRCRLPSVRCCCCCRGSILAQIWNATKTARSVAKKKRAEGAEEQVEHWLDHGKGTGRGSRLAGVVSTFFFRIVVLCNAVAKKAHGDQTVEDVKAVIRILPVFCALPIFWTLYYQQGSTW